MGNAVVAFVLQPTTSPAHAPRNNDLSFDDGGRQAAWRRQWTRRLGLRCPLNAADRIARPVTIARVAESLDRLQGRYLTDDDRPSPGDVGATASCPGRSRRRDPDHAGRPHATVPRDWADRAYRVVNEWNHTRRFCKAYVGDPTKRGQLPIYAEMQMPLMSGVHEALLDELLDCAAAVTTTSSTGSTTRVPC